MSEKDVVENVDSPGEIAIPIANNSTPGIASFDSNDFTVGADGKVSSIVERGIPQYIGKITGTGTGTTDLNWEVDTNTVKQNKPIKLGEYIMLTEHFNQFVPGDIFRITSVQIEGSKYTVKTNNVRALSLASIIGPQGEQGSEGPQGVPYLAYTGSIESTTDPAPGSTMQLEDGHFNRTPIASSAEYQDVVTVDWYNKTTHRAFMVTGYIQSKDSATNQWVALITAATDITGAVGPQGKEGAGIADIVDIDYPHGEFTSVKYDTTNGIKMQGIAEYLRDDGETYQIPTDIKLPIIAGAGLSIDKKATEEKVEIKSLNSNLANGTGDVLVQTTDTNHSLKVMTDGRAKVKTAPTENDDVVRKLELNGKLTKPANPSAESAVTMLADGTVGTKLLSEIGGGGKLHLHKFYITMKDNPSEVADPVFIAHMTIINNTRNEITTFADLSKWTGDAYTLVYVDNVRVDFELKGFSIVSLIFNNNESVPCMYFNGNSMDMIMLRTDSSNILDTVTEL